MKIVTIHGEMESIGPCQISENGTITGPEQAALIEVGSIVRFSPSPTGEPLRVGGGYVDGIVGSRFGLRGGTFAACPAACSGDYVIVEKRDRAREKAEGMLAMHMLHVDQTPPLPQAAEPDDHAVLVAYLLSAVRRKDWHAVSDAANDLRVLEAQRTASRR